MVARRSAGESCSHCQEVAGALVGYSAQAPLWRLRDWRAGSWTREVAWSLVVCRATSYR